MEILEVQALLDSLDLLFGCLCATLIASSTLEAVVLDFAIELNLRLCARRTNADLDAVLGEPL
jgi:hypothetical protein